MKSIIVATLLTLASLAQAAEVQFQWTLSGVDCNGDPIPVDTYTEIEIYMSPEPIPATSEPCGIAVDTPPSGLIRVAGAAAANVVRTDVSAGVYYARARVSDGRAWSNFSQQVEVVVERGALRPPVIVRLPL